MKMKVVRQCVVCNTESSVEVDTKKYFMWQRARATGESGNHIQDVFPELTPDEREVLLSGTHPECWDGMWGEE
jgi:hypothetical protein